MKTIMVTHEVWKKLMALKKQHNFKQKGQVVEWLIEQYEKNVSWEV